MKQNAFDLMLDNKLPIEFFIFFFLLIILHYSSNALQTIALSAQQTNSHLSFCFFFSFSISLSRGISIEAGNSNSVANLVENEINPTSMHVPISDDMLPNLDTDTLGHLTPFNNMKGSYNNLFCDNLDDDTVQTLDPSDPANVQATNQLLENVYCNISPMQTTAQSTGKGGSIATEPTITTAKHIVDNLLASHDPSLHVYSNVSNATINDNDTHPTTNSTPKVNDVLTPMSKSTLPIKTKLTSDNNSSLNSNNIESIISQSMLNKSSKLLSDNLNDLDLDDPTLVSGSIVNTPSNANTNTSTMSKVLKSSSDSIGANNNKFSSSKKAKHSLSVDDSRSNISKKLFNDSTTPLEVMVDNENGNGSYLRSLHDTTMIDTALDLDSIEDTNIGIQNAS